MKYWARGSCVGQVAGQALNDQQLYVNCGFILGTGAWAEQLRQPLQPMVMRLVSSCFCSRLGTSSTSTPFS